ncbi:hypothetical protein [Streptomyces sp. NPDC005281]|uniref:hypothetical protein n=1 Tax=Streptomyces sp. NPDC005281 TaxID=3155712 RepID=UPI0033B790DA
MFEEGCQALVLGLLFLRLLQGLAQATFADGGPLRRIPAAAFGSRGPRASLRLGFQSRAGWTYGRAVHHTVAPGPVWACTCPCRIHRIALPSGQAMCGHAALPCSVRGSQV